MTRQRREKDICIQHFAIAQKPTKSLRGMPVSLKDPLPTLEWWNVVCNIPCSDCPNAHADQDGRQLSRYVKEQKGTVKPQDGNSILAGRIAMHLIRIQLPSLGKEPPSIHAI